MRTTTATVNGLTLERYAESKRLPPEFLLRDVGVRTVTPFEKRPHIAIDYHDEAGDVVFTKYRGAGNTKFWSDPGTRPTLYGLDRLAQADPSKPVLLVEGESDCHAGWFHGLLVVGVPGANVWRREWAPLLAGRHGWIWQEPDHGGEQFVRRVAADLEGLRVIQAAPGVKDLSDLHMQGPAGFLARLAELAGAAAEPPPPEPRRPHRRRQKYGHRPGCGCERCALEPSRYSRRRDAARHNRPLPVEQARQVSTLAVAERLGLELHRAGRGWRGRCPLHNGDNTSSFSILEDGGARCWSCGWSGDTIALVQGVRGVEFADAVRELARIE